MVLMGWNFLGLLVECFGKGRRRSNEALRLCCVTLLHDSNEINGDCSARSVNPVPIVL